MLMCDSRDIPMSEIFILTFYHILLNMNFDNNFKQRLTTARILYIMKSHSKTKTTIYSTLYFVVYFGKKLYL